MIFHENTKGTQGPGHFTVRREAPHYRAHPLRFCGFLRKVLKTPQEIQEIQEMQERAASARQAKPFPNFQWSVLRAVARPKSALICEICGSMEGVA